MGRITWPQSIEILRIGTELIVGAASSGRKELHSALSRIPFANGQVFLSTLAFMEKLPLDIPQTAVPKKLFLNLLEYAHGD